jgi:hypothetical protein
VVVTHITLLHHQVRLFVLLLNHLPLLNILLWLVVEVAVTVVVAVLVLVDTELQQVWVLLLVSVLP